MGAYGGTRAKLIPQCGLLSLSINTESASTSLKIYPNPVIEYLQIESPNKTILDIELTNTKGIIVLQVPVNQVQCKLYTKQFAPGMYVLKLIFKDGVHCQKLFIH